MKQTTKLKTATFKFRLAVDEKKAFEDAADAAGLTLAAWMRERLRRASILDLQNVGKVPAFLLNIVKE